MVCNHMFLTQDRNWVANESTVFFFPFKQLQTIDKPLKPVFQIQGKQKFQSTKKNSYTF